MSFDSQVKCSQRSAFLLLSYHVYVGKLADVFFSLPHWYILIVCSVIPKIFNIDTIFLRCIVK